MKTYEYSCDITPSVCHELHCIPLAPKNQNSTHENETERECGAASCITATGTTP
jgi:hypothetical protein